MPTPAPRRWTAKRVAAVSALPALVVVAALFALSPVGRALLRSTSGFTPRPVDARVRASPGAEAFGDALAAVLDSAIREVESALGRPYTEPFEVLACATQGECNAFFALPPELPIRGSVRFGDVFIAPSAFRWEGLDTHRESLVHELVHVHVRQHLGFRAHRARVPAWFNEALADLVAGSGGEGISDEEAMRAIRAGRSLRPDSTGALLSLRRAGSYGLPGPMLHKQSTMFLAWLRARDPVAYERFIGEFFAQRAFARPFRTRFGGSVGELWTAFVAEAR